ncbi:MAG TPA: glycoside hydrolase family 127 protein, partial [Spirochaetia bacterium]|nr:glycoside hydrolase family 127 protein [Spirochaetia bacterium]
VLYADLFHDGRISLPVGNRQAAFRQRTDYPWAEQVAFEYVADSSVELDLAIRIPSWCSGASLRLNGSAFDLRRAVEKGYAHVAREWRPGDRVELVLPMPVQRVRSDPRVAADFGKVAVQRGPVVYCLEEADNGPSLHAAVLPREARLESAYHSDMLGGMVIVKARGRAWDGAGTSNGLYQTDGRPPGTTQKDLLFIPYFAWANRQPGEMTVWVGE